VSKLSDPRERFCVEWLLVWVGWGELLFLTQFLRGGGKNSTALVASYPALTFFLKKGFNYKLRKLY